jgi:hypothetical protein
MVFDCLAYRTMLAHSCARMRLHALTWRVTPSQQVLSPSVSRSYPISPTLSMHRGHEMSISSTRLVPLMYILHPRGMAHTYWSGESFPPSHSALSPSPPNQFSAPPPHAQLDWVCHHYKGGHDCAQRRGLERCYPGVVQADLRTRRRPSHLKYLHRTCWKKL